MHALPIKPRLAVVRTEHEKGMDHPLALSPKHVGTPGHTLLPSSPPKSTPIETHRIEPEDETLGSHRLPQTDLARIHSVGQHVVAIDVDEEVEH